MADGKLLAGTSGYSYAEWKPAFYPADLPAAQFLSYYAGRLATVEINNTFYRFPAEKQLADWSAHTPVGFVFAIKAVQKITHTGRLKDVGDLTRDFVERCRGLGDKLGPILFQLPPNFRRDDARLDAFLNGLPAGRRYALEFRHESWFDEAVLARLRGAGVALCISEGEHLDSPRVATADFCYLRLRKPEYGEGELRAWRAWIVPQLHAGRDVYTYLKHDEHGESPEHALRLLAGS
ncbi:MAG TPA: DUF72 domain-containing protein [Phycisphaerae bacterium]|nr:DUF72 domain-containing protein [Phycisphaerae bacterium]